MKKVIWTDADYVMVPALRSALEKIDEIVDWINKQEEKRKKKKGRRFGSRIFH